MRIKKPESWNHTEELTRDQLNATRDEFWGTAPHYGGKQGYFFNFNPTFK